MRVSFTVNTPAWMEPILDRVRSWMVSSGNVRRAYKDAQTLASPFMEDNFNLWYEMYLNRPPWADRRIVPLGLPAAIGRELAQYVFMESDISVTDNRFSENTRAGYLDAQLQTAAGKFKTQMEAGLCLGGIALKPWPDGGRIQVSCAWPSQFTPTELDGTGTVIGGVFRETVKEGGNWYVRLERHSFQDEGGKCLYVVENRAFRSDSTGNPGVEVPLSDVSAWAELTPIVRLENLTGPLFAYFAPPISNNVDPQSPVGVSIYSGATVGLIRSADQQWEKLAWEYYSGRRKIFTDAVTGIGLSQFGRDLFEVGRYSKNGSVFEQFTPEFRDEALLRGLNELFKRIEFNVGLAYGTLSDPQAVEKTATEIAAAKSRQRSTVKEIQRAFQDTLERLVYAMDVYVTLYKLAPPGPYEVSCAWGDGVLDDKETDLREKAVDMQEVSAGILNPWEYRAKWMHEDEAVAKANLPGMETMTEGTEDEIE
ncbi:MAG: hypothetical protein IJT94_17340 [Oscillibacter sp.]|nr:hypothetical protein [Oscillibacter sp.]